MDVATFDGWWEDPETLHQARVASRRLRTVLGLLDPELYPTLKRCRKRVKNLTDILGPMRELEVHKQVLEELGPELPGPHGWAALEHVLEYVEAQRVRCQNRLPNQLRKLDLSRLNALLPRPAFLAPGEEAPMDAAWNFLQPRVNDVIELLPNLREEEDPIALHQLRLFVKKLRYALEVFAPAFPAENTLDTFLSVLKHLQDVLGHHHDYAVLEAMLQPMQERLEVRFRRVLSEGMHEIMLQLAHERVDQFDHFCVITQYFSPEGFRTTLREHLGLSPS